MVACVTFASSVLLINRGAIRAARRPRMTMTTMSSMSVNPVRKEDFRDVYVPIKPLIFIFALAKK
jgi:hypothetical protein